MSGSVLDIVRHDSQHPHFACGSVQAKPFCIRNLLVMRGFGSWIVHLIKDRRLACGFNCHCTCTYEALPYIYIYIYI